MQIKKSGILTKVIVLALLIYMATSLLDLRGQIQANLAQKDALTSQIADQAQENAQLADAIENQDDPDVLESVARSKGFVKAGEKLYVDIAN